MKRVGVLVTGMAEKALPGALERLFGHAFFPILENEREGRPFASFNSAPPPPSAATPTVLKVIQRVAAELDRGSADYIVIVDDLELVNLAAREPVLENVRLAVRAHLAALRVRDRILAETLTGEFRKRVSFHLAVPMLEAWFFADPGALATLALVTPPKLAPGRDPEAFETADPAYATDDGSTCTRWLQLAEHKQRQHRPTWMCADRTHHPKAYLAWLLKDHSEKGCSRYKETDHGVRLLERLELPVALRAPGHCNYLRALIEDLMIALDEPLPWLEDPAFAVPTRHIHGGRVLRNL